MVRWWRRGGDGEVDDEMRFHLEMETERLVRERGLDAAEARRQAHIAFGGVEKYKEQARDVRPFRWMDSLALDTKLGVRMLRKHLGLTIVGGFAMAVAIAVGATAFEVVVELLNPVLPVEHGGRVVALQVSDSRGETGRIVQDLIAGRRRLAALEQLGAFRTARHNLLSAGVAPEPIEVAEMTASGFTLAGTRPLVGRHLLASDERPGAPPVLVLGHRAWQSRFRADPDILHRAINLGGKMHAIVGVMPEGFAFPLNHQFWVPLRREAVAPARLRVFGRLAPGVGMEEAQTELLAAAQAAVAGGAEPPQARVLPFTREHLGVDDPGVLWVIRAGQLLVGALAFVVAVNLAILIYARTVTRRGEIAVRAALGASRRRILGQLFVEALALTVLGASGGLLLARVALERVELLVRTSGGVIPFWARFDLSIWTVLYAFALAALAALVMGVLPGLKATGAGLNVTINELNGRSGTRLGAVWTTLVVAQVAAAVAFLPVAVYLSWQVVHMELAGSGFAVDDIVVATISAGDDARAVDAERMKARQVELVSRLQREPGVTAVTWSTGVPGFAGDRRIEFAGGTDLRRPGMQDVSTLDVEPGLFGVYEAKVLAGRLFDPTDTGAGRSVIVNRAFVQVLLGEANDSSARGILEGRALGTRFRYVDGSVSGWHQIVGIVGDFPRFPAAPRSEGQPTVYHPGALAGSPSLVFSIRFNGSIPAGIQDRVRLAAAAVDPSLQVRRIVPLSNFYDELRAFWRNLAWAAGMVTLSVLLLSAAGIYALLSFTLAQRTREIGVRIALGAAPRRLLLGVFGRALTQIAAGIAAGSAVSGLLLAGSGIGAGAVAAVLLAVGGIILAVGLLAAIGPARRSLRIDATEALRTDG